MSWHLYLEGTKPNMQQSFIVFFYYATSCNFIIWYQGIHFQYCEKNCDSFYDKEIKEKVTWNPFFFLKKRVFHKQTYPWYYDLMDSPKFSHKDVGHIL